MLLEFSDTLRSCMDPGQVHKMLDRESSIRPAASRIPSIAKTMPCALEHDVVLYTSAFVNKWS